VEQSFKYGTDSGDDDLGYIGCTGLGPAVVNVSGENF
jgi:hypothetical protein